MRGTRQSSRTLAAVLVAGTLAALPACEREQDAALAPGQAFVEEPVAVVHPQLGGFEDSVRRVIEEEIVRFDAARAGLTAAELAAAYARLGLLYEAHHLYEPAMAALRWAVHLDPVDYQWHYYLAYAQRETGATDAAIAGFQRVLDLRPDNEPARVHLARSCLDARRLDCAMDQFQRVAQGNPRNAAAHAGLAGVALEREQYAQAVEHLRTALQLAPGANRLHYPLAMAYRGLGDTAQARRHLALAGDREAPMADPLIGVLGELSRSAQFHLERGRALVAARQYAAAERAFRVATAVNPADPAAHATLGRVLEQLGRPAQALGEYTAALELDAEYPVAHYFLGSLLEQRGDVVPAQEHYRAALRADPGYVEPRFLLAGGLMREGRFEEAAEHYAALTGTRAESLEFHYWHGMAWLAAGRCERALEPLARAHELNPRYGTAMLALARAYATCPVATSEQTAMALELARQLHDAVPEDATMQATLAMALAANGDYAAAVAVQEAVHALRAEDAVVAGNLVRFRAGERAAAAWTAADPVYSPPPLRRGGAKRGAM